MAGGVHHWIADHPGPAGTLAGWYQQACSLVPALVAVPLVIRRLTPVDAGLWFSFQSVLAFVALADFGLSTVLARQIAFSLTLNQTALPHTSEFFLTARGWAGVAEVHRIGCRLFRGLFAIGLVAVVLLYHLILPAGRFLTGAGPSTATAWYLLSLATLVSLQTRPHQAVLDGIGQVYWSRVLLGTQLLVSGLGIVTILLIGGGLPAMAAWVLTAAVLHYAAVGLLVRRRLAPVRSEGSWATPGLARHLGRVALPMGTLILSSFLVSSIQAPALGFLLGPQSVPPFYVAQRIGQTLNLAVMQVLHPQLPLFTQELASGQLPSARARMRRTILLVTLLALVANALFFLGTPWILKWWTGRAEYVARNLLLVLALDYLLLSAAVVWGHFVLASGRNPFLWSAILSGLANVTLLYLLVPRFGLLGAAFAGLGAGLLINYWYVPWCGIRTLRHLRLAEERRA